MGSASETDRGRSQATRGIIGNLSCPSCGGHRLQFGGDRENPWRCAGCDASFRIPNGLLNSDGTQDAAESLSDAERSKSWHRRPGAYAGGPYPDHRGASDAPLPLPNALLTALAWPLKLAMTLTGLAVIVLGAHGMYVYLNVVQGVPGAEGSLSGLFLVVDVPTQLAGIVSWCSTSALGSWVVPVSLIFGGSLLIWVRERW